MTKKRIKVERLILWILILGAILTFGISLILGNELFYTDYAGIFGIATVSIISFSKPKKSLGALFILLTLGLFDLLGFIAFSPAFSFGLDKFGFNIVSPGIQIYSLILLMVLISKRKKELLDLYHNSFGQSEEEYKESKEAMTQKFINKFENLSDNQVLERLDHDLIPEAKEALMEIKKKRNI